MSLLRSTTVLMYHAIEATEGADPHYAVSRDAFLGHLHFLSLAGLAPRSVCALLAGGTPPGGAVGITFDDGHGSNARAARDLADQGGSADFFVNPSTIGTRHFLSWAALRDMAAAGMSIQSHGHTHRYFDEMDDGEAQGELARSRAEIEDHLGRPVTLFAPPGGRLGRHTAAIARRVGYTAICSSRPGVWDGQRHGMPELPRLAVMAATSERQFRRWVDQDDVELVRQVLRHEGLAVMKRALGNSRYERVRAKLLRVREEA